MADDDTTAAASRTPAARDATDVDIDAASASPSHAPSTASAPVNPSASTVSDTTAGDTSAGAPDSRDDNSFHAPPQQWYQHPMVTALAHACTLLTAASRRGFHAARTASPFTADQVREYLAQLARRAAKPAAREAKVIAMLWLLWFGTSRSRAFLRDNVFGRGRGTKVAAARAVATTLLPWGVLVRGYACYKVLQWLGLPQQHRVLDALAKQAKRGLSFCSGIGGADDSALGCGHADASSAAAAAAADAGRRFSASHAFSVKVLSVWFRLLYRFQLQFRGLRSFEFKVGFAVNEPQDADALVPPADVGMHHEYSVAARDARGHTGHRASHHHLMPSLVGAGAVTQTPSPLGVSMVGDASQGHILYPATPSLSMHPSPPDAPAVAPIMNTPEAASRRDMEWLRTALKSGNSVVSEAAHSGGEDASEQQGIGSGAAATATGAGRPPPSPRPAQTMFSPAASTTNGTGDADVAAPPHVRTVAEPQMSRSPAIRTARQRALYGVAAATAALGGGTARTTTSGMRLFASPPAHPVLGGALGGVARQAHSRNRVSLSADASHKRWAVAGRGTARLAAAPRVNAGTPARRDGTAGAALKAAERSAEAPARGITVSVTDVASPRSVRPPANRSLLAALQTFDSSKLRPAVAAAPALPAAEGAQPAARAATPPPLTHTSTGGASAPRNTAGPRSRGPPVVGLLSQVASFDRSSLRKTPSKAEAAAAAAADADCEPETDAGRGDASESTCGGAAKGRGNRGRSERTMLQELGAQLLKRRRRISDARFKQRPDKPARAPVVIGLEASRVACPEPSAAAEGEGPVDDAGSSSPATSCGISVFEGSFSPETPLVGVDDDSNIDDGATYGVRRSSAAASKGGSRGDGLTAQSEHRRRRGRRDNVYRRSTVFGHPQSPGTLYR